MANPKRKLKNYGMKSQQLSIDLLNQMALAMMDFFPKPRKL
jgi:hypothetical protein